MGITEGKMQSQGIRTSGLSHGMSSTLEVTIRHSYLLLQHMRPKQPSCSLV